MRTLLRELIEKHERDRQLPFHVRVIKAKRYALELATASVYLHAADEVGARVRTAGRPRIDNLGYLRVGDGVLLRSSVVPVELATAPGARLIIGDEVRINYGASLGATGEIRIGDRVRIGPYAMIVDSDFHGAYDRAQRPAARPVVIDEDVWIGAKASVLRGVRVGRGAIIGAHALVTRDVPPFTVVAGVPARALYQLEPTRFATGGADAHKARA